MTPSALLEELKPLSHDHPMYPMVEIGRQARNNPSIASTLDIMAEGNFEDRYNYWRIFLPGKTHTEK